MQNTVEKEVVIIGIGLHSGRKITMKLLPAPENSGIVFRNSYGEVKAKFDNVHSTNMSTKLLNGHSTIDLVEHLMAGLWGANIDNVIVELDSIEVPILDGSARGFIDEIMKVGTRSQAEPKKVFKVKSEIKVCEEDKYVVISPSDSGLVIDMTIDFDHKAIGCQRFIFDSSKDSFVNEIATARTFGFMKDLDHLHNSGLALGASLKNCIVLTDDKIANSEGLLFPNEFVRHKILDCIGDLFLSGYYLEGRVTGYKSGHKLNNMALKKLFEAETV